MFVIKMNGDKTLSKTVVSTNFKYENNAETILFLLPKQYGGTNLSDCSIQLYILNPNNLGQSYTLNLESELYKDILLQSYFPITADITSVIGNYEVWLNIVDASTSTVIKTGSTYIPVSDKKDISDYFSSSDLDTMDKIIIDTTALKDTAVTASETATQKASDASISAQSALDSKNLAEGYKNTAANTLSEVQTTAGVATEAKNTAVEAANTATSAAVIATDAKTAAALSEQNAKTSEDSANTSATNAHTSELNAATSESNALTYANNAAAVAVKTPYIDGGTKTWWVWSSAANTYVDTGINATGETGPQGPQGETGATGATGPQGETGPAGSDASVTANSVNLAFASASDEQKQTMRERINAEKSKGVYELIETITLTEDTASVVRTQEPDGTPYAFKAIGVVVQAEVGSVNSGIIVSGEYNSTRLQSGFINGAITDTIKRYGYAQIYPDWGVWAAIGSTAVNGFNWTVTQMTGYSPGQAFSVKESENPYCTQVTLQVNISGATIPTGTIIQIYGVRA